MTERPMPPPVLIDDEYEARCRNMIDGITGAYANSQGTERDADEAPMNVEALYSLLLNMEPDVDLPTHSGFLAMMLAVAIDELSKA